MFGICEYVSSKMGIVNMKSILDKRSGALFKTIIVGDNASGKTRFLISIIDIFRFISYAQNSEHSNHSKDLKAVYRDIIKEHGEVDLKYKIGRSIFSLQFGPNGPYYFKNEKKCILAEVEIPQQIIAVTTTHNDKFPYSDNSKDPFYKYCGIRETSNASWTATLTRKTIENLLKLSGNGRNGPIKALFEQLKLKTSIRIRFKPKSIDNFKAMIASPEKMHQIVTRYSERTNRMQVDLFRALSDDDTRDYAKALDIISFSKEHGHIDIDLLSGENYEKTGEALNILRRVTQINNIELQLFRENSKTPHLFSAASSGETQLLYSFTSLLHYARDNSAILIDEPEISLHPNWQIRYISLLKKTLSHIKNSHIIIASHSHFLVSDLDQKNSSLHSFKNTTGNIEVENIDYSTYAWSPENILYSVFNVRTVGNLSFERDVNKALRLISEKSDDITSLRLLGEKLNSLVFDEGDPLNEVVNSIMDYIHDHH